MRASLLCLLALLVAITWPAAAPAQAKVCAGHPSDPSVVCARDQARTVDVCDRQADGHRAYARVVTQATYPAFQSPYYDANDSREGCTNLHFDSAVVSIQACVQYEGCGAAQPTGVPPPQNTTPPPPAPTPPPAPAPAPPPQSGTVQLGVGLGCTPRGGRMRVSLTVHRRPGRAKPRVKRVVFFYKKKSGRVARSDRRRPYRRALPVRLAPGPHRVYARVYYKRPGGSKLRKRTVHRRFVVCA